MGSWGRHGWPRKDEGVRIYRERNGCYFLIEPDLRNSSGYSAIANVLSGKEPSLGSCSIPDKWIREVGAKRVQWSELPKEWQVAFRRWLVKSPEEYRGLWLIGHQPNPA